MNELSATVVKIGDFEFAFPQCVPIESAAAMISGARAEVRALVESHPDRGHKLDFIEAARRDGIIVAPKPERLSDDALHAAFVRVIFRTIERTILEKFGCPSCSRPGGIH